jgi:hypothetical protein
MLSFVAMVLFQTSHNQISISILQYNFDFPQVEKRAIHPIAGYMLVHPFVGKDSLFCAFPLWSISLFIRRYPILAKGHRQGSIWTSGDAAPQQ